ncbi:MAG TPA: NAD(P)H-quinone oxidoreductase [Nocardioidaceae bacterium]|nr:NAD(P)H-quinone oxidoreductase [Nocardioidaceae bacterium]
MRAVTLSQPGGPDVLHLAERPDPAPGHGEVVLEVAAAAVNRADLLQRQGNYPPPPGASQILGLECAGTVAQAGEGVGGWAVGDQACALLAGGGYATRVAVPAEQLLPVPGGLSLVAAASLPEAACTVWSNVFMLAALRPGELLLVHGGAGGIGTLAIQVAKALGARVAATAGSAEKCDLCQELGADLAIRYDEQDFVAEVRRFESAGADVVLDGIGAAYLSRNIDVLATEGRLVVIGLQGGSRGELDLGKLLRKRAAVLATALRSRPVEQKAAIIRGVVDHVWPLVATGKLRPVVGATFPLARAADAHALVESGAHHGKIVLTVD